MLTDNGVYVDQSANGEFSLFLFKDKNNSQDMFIVRWNGKSTRAPSLSTVYLQVFNRTSSTWETIASNNSANANTDFSLFGIKESGLANYYDGNNWVSCRIYQQAI